MKRTAVLVGLWVVLAASVALLSGAYIVGHAAGWDDAYACYVLERGC